MLQTTTNISRYTSDALAQDNSSEGGSYSSFSPCPLCHCMFNPVGDCCCDGVPAIGYYYYCSCGICGLYQPCNIPHMCIPNSGGDAGSGGSTGDDGSSGGGGTDNSTTPSNSCACCGQAPCICYICPCCHQSKCICTCPSIEFTSGTYPFNGTYWGYVFMENWGILYGGCSYYGYLSTMDNNFSGSALMKIGSPNHSATFSGIIKYFHDYVYSGCGVLSGTNMSNSIIYDSSYTYLGTYNGTITETPCHIGELEVTLSFYVYEFFYGSTSNIVFQNKYLITNQTTN